MINVSEEPRLEIPDYTLKIEFHDGRVTKPAAGSRAFVMTKNKEIRRGRCLHPGDGNSCPTWQIENNSAWRPVCRWWAEYVHDPSWDQ